MYQFKPKATAARSRLLREDIAVAPLPDLGGAPVDPVDPALAGIVSAVEPVQPMTKRYRATVTRTVTETALVEFDAPETADLYTMAEALLPQIPADAWVESPADSWGYIDRIEAVEAAVDPAAALADDMPDDEEDPAAPATAGRSRGVRIVGYRRNGARRAAAGRSVRMTAEEATASADDILARAQQVVAVAPVTSTEAGDQIFALEGLAAEIDELAAASFTDDMPDADAAASEIIASTQSMIADMLAAANETEAALLATEGAGADPALEPVY